VHEPAYAGKNPIVSVIGIYQQFTSPYLKAGTEDLLPSQPRRARMGVECWLMKFLLVILVAGCQISFGQDRDALAFAGCYELRAEGQQTHISNYGAVPSRLQLTLERDSINGTLVAKRLDSRVKAYWRWHIQCDGSVEISPSGGWITDGWFIQLSRSGSEFRGTARYWTDTGDGGSTFVVGHKVACNQQRKVRSRVNE
jgi:hypothetical protein